MILAQMGRAAGPFRYHGRLPLAGLLGIAQQRARLRLDAAALGELGELLGAPRRVERVLHDLCADSAGEAL